MFFRVWLKLVSETLSSSRPFFDRSLPLYFAPPAQSSRGYPVTHDGHLRSCCTEGIDKFIFNQHRKSSGDRVRCPSVWAAVAIPLLKVLPAQRKRLLHRRAYDLRNQAING